MNILLVDDEPIIHQTLGDYLRASGHTVSEAKSGAAALKTLRAREGLTSF